MNNMPTDMKFYKYIVESFVILLPDDPVPIVIEPKHITDIAIERDYDDDYYPIIRLSTILTPTVYFNILKNKLGVRFKLRIQKFIYDKSNQFQFKTDVFNRIFSVYLNEDTPFMSQSTYDETKKVEKSETTPKDLSNEFTFYLFNEWDLINTRRINNKIFSNCNMTDVLTHMLGINHFIEVLMTPLDNTTVYEEVIFPPLPFLGGLLALEQAYGFYKNGLLLFFDVECTYFIDLNVKCTAFRLAEYTQTVFNIRDSISSDVFTPGSYVDDINKKFIINVLPNTIQMHSHSIVTDQTEGNNLLIINPETGITTDLRTNSTERKDGTYKVMVNKNNNKYCNSMAKLQRSENSKIITLSIGDFDTDVITPNKEFLFVFENQKINTEYGGNYRISKNHIVFNKQGEDFTINATCEFRKYTE